MSAPAGGARTEGAGAPSRGVVVTGSSRGVGAATARAFAARGDRVVVHYHGSEDLARDVLGSLPGEGHGLVQADLGDPAAVERLAAEAVGVLGRVDVLVNNAAMIVAPRRGAAGAGRTRWRRRHTGTGSRSGSAPWRPTCSARPT
ncbi:SDR family NAD(P)-dependent oxidoreductase [Ornithinimicrobium sp. CNJ-824]|uniref:SDR family NAD(P)-dependent oxidoreductase n=1 Tax=Ornithinimicrobium sp. CNJ-824 TaxID=1904966 RepID=UPI0022A960A7|nr:SDR family NAD(P)-dependent oxidoreductase [Ornithinimicrobium sp. CNJ-824]